MSAWHYVLDPWALAAVRPRQPHYVLDPWFHQWRQTVSHGLAVEPARTGWRRCAGSREDPGVDDPRCRANQHDRVFAGGKARRYAPPTLRGADRLDTGLRARNTLQPRRAPRI